MVTQKDGRRNRCQIQALLPLPCPTGGNAPPARPWPSWPERTPASDRGDRELATARIRYRLPAGAGLPPDMAGQGCAAGQMNAAKAARAIPFPPGWLIALSAELALPVRGALV
jgi:hypothetical protein